MDDGIIWMGTTESTSEQMGGSSLWLAIQVYKDMVISRLLLQWSAQHQQGLPPLVCPPRL